MADNQMMIISYENNHSVKNSMESVIYLLLTIAMAIPSVMSFARYDIYAVRGIWVMPFIVVSAVNLVKHTPNLHNMILSGILLMASYGFIPFMLYKYLTQTVGIVIDSPVILCTPRMIASFMFALIFLFARSAEFAIKNI